ncbi:MAG: hypothetical protein LBO77_00945 [Desulfovibrio sp.]|jgi:uncharacterized membrane protein YhaH (DUF805 family)|nr:hypothetical protein [Desulfovibrio sp.]
MTLQKQDPLLIRALVGMMSLRGAMSRAEFIVALPFVFMVGAVCFAYIFTSLGEGYKGSLLFFIYGLFTAVATIPQAKRLRDIGLPRTPAWLAGLTPQLLPLLLANVSPDSVVRKVFWEGAFLAWIVFLAAAPTRRRREEGAAESEE